MGEPRPCWLLFAFDPNRARYRRPWRSFTIAVALFVATAFSTLAAGAQFAEAYAHGYAPTFDNFFVDYFRPFSDPRLFLPGIPFAGTLLGILLAHELGHFLACRHYGIRATYPYFIPAPTLIGTAGAFIRIRSPIVNRRALFDVALAGPVVGFLMAVVCLAIAVAHSKVAPADQAAAPLLFGRSLVEQGLEAWLQPGVPPEHLLLHPVGRAAWVGLFATALNLLPAGQLDGGHIIYSLSSRHHRAISLAVAAGMVPLALISGWAGWILWAVILVAIGFRHPPLIDGREPLDPIRQAWAALALAIFLLCFMPAPFTI